MVGIPRSPKFRDDSLLPKVAERAAIWTLVAKSLNLKLLGGWWSPGDMAWLHWLKTIAQKAPDSGLIDEMETHRMVWLRLG
jgi:hypothetical protein